MERSVEHSVEYLVGHLVNRLVDHLVDHYMVMYGGFLLLVGSVLLLEFQHLSEESFI